MIYRKIFSREIAKNHRFQQKKISSICGTSWRREPKYVKDEYHKLATEVDKLFLQLREENLFQERIEWNKQVDSPVTSQKSEQLPLSSSPLNKSDRSIDDCLKEFDSLNIPEFSYYDHIEINHPIVPNLPYINYPLIENLGPNNFNYQSSFNLYHNLNPVQYELQPSFYDFQSSSTPFLDDSFDFNNL